MVGATAAVKSEENGLSQRKLETAGKSERTVFSWRNWSKLFSTLQSNPNEALVPIQSLGFQVEDS